MVLRATSFDLIAISSLKFPLFNAYASNSSVSFSEVACLIETSKTMNKLKFKRGVLIELIYGHLSIQEVEEEEEEQHPHHCQINDIEIVRIMFSF